MNMTHATSFLVLYSARHQRCGQIVERTDFRVVTKQDLFAWSHEISANEPLVPLPLHCDSCAEDVQATHVRIIKDADPHPRTIVPEVEIRKFKPEDWIIKMQEDY